MSLIASHSVRRLSRLTSPTYPNWSRFIAVFVAAGLIIAARRWIQFVNPDVWVEDGTQVIPSFINYGWLGLFMPTTGYLIIPAKVVSFTALSLSFLHYAFISTVLATLAQSACVATIATAPTMLPARIICALVVVLVPTATEVFALPLYTFWWTTLLLFVALLWNGLGLMWPRYLFAAIGVFSSPLGVALAPVFIVRALAERRRSETKFCLFSLACMTVQFFVILSEKAKSGSLRESLSHLDVLISRYFGMALFDLDIHGAGALGCLLILFLVISYWVLPRPDRLPYGLLCLCLGIVVLSSSARMPVTGPHPVLAGPRYFFFSTSIVFWMLVWTTIRGPRILSVVGALLIGTYVPALLTVFRFDQQVPKLAWEEQVKACMADQDYTFDIQYGLPFIHWEVTLSGENCRTLSARSLLG